MCCRGCQKLFMCFHCTLRCSCVPPFIPLYPLFPPSPLFLSNGQSGIDIISLEDPSLCQSLFIYSMATGLIMVSLPPPLSRTLTSCLAYSPSLSLFPSASLSLSLRTLLVSYLRESLVFTNGFTSNPLPASPH